MSGLAVWGTFSQQGSLRAELLNDALLLLQVFMATISVTAMSVAALTWDRKRADQRRRATRGDCRVLRRCDRQQDR